jgi:hypothetical protein
MIVGRLTISKGKPLGGLKEYVVAGGLWRSKRKGGSSTLIDNEENFC